MSFFKKFRTQDPQRRTQDLDIRTRAYTHTSWEPNTCITCTRTRTCTHKYEHLHARVHKHVHVHTYTYKCIYFNIYGSLLSIPGPRTKESGPGTQDPKRRTQDLGPMGRYLRNRIASPGGLLRAVGIEPILAQCGPPHIINLEGR